MELGVREGVLLIHRSSLQRMVRAEYRDYLCSIGMRPLTQLLPLHCNVLRCFCRPEGALNKTTY